MDKKSDAILILEEKTSGKTGFKLINKVVKRQIITLIKLV
ncbi:hypothetical protein Phpb_02837 [Photorhabdus namnaonensis]|uniref:Uncharacterized protein n=1 Tax=Photorhabdus namnaonensis TaxID=1851568 RepID=A0A1B8YGW6_9GAMM|nr:hypothetical protein Phpb_02837 [Photorhabdus namnaonensis]